MCEVLLTELWSDLKKDWRKRCRLIIIMSRSKGIKWSSWMFIYYWDISDSTGLMAKTWSWRENGKPITNWISLKICGTTLIWRGIRNNIDNTVVSNGSCSICWTGHDNAEILLLWIRWRPGSVKSWTMQPVVASISSINTSSDSCQNKTTSICLWSTPILGWIVKNLRTRKRPLSLFCGIVMPY